MDVPDGHRIPEVAEDVIAPAVIAAVLFRRQSHRHNRLTLKVFFCLKSPTQRLRYIPVVHRCATVQLILDSNDRMTELLSSSEGRQDF